MSKRKRICIILIILLLMVSVAIMAAFQLHVYIEKKNIEIEQERTEIEQECIETERENIEIEYENIEIYTVTPEEVGTFSVDDYQYDIMLFRSDKNLGSVETLDEVTYKAQTAWNEEFCAITKAGLHIPNPGEGIEVFFDGEEECWLVKGTMPQVTTFPDGSVWTGAIPHVILRTNGDVVAMWMG